MQFIGLMKKDGSSIKRGGRIVYLRTSLNMIPMNYALSLLFHFFETFPRHNNLCSFANIQCYLFRLSLELLFICSWLLTNLCR